MKRLISAILCLVMMFTFVPVIFASAAPADAVVETAEAAGDSAGSSDLDIDLSWIKDFFTLVSGIWEKIGGDTIILTIKTILTNFLEIVSLSEFAENIKAIWNDVK